MIKAISQHSIKQEKETTYLSFLFFYYFLTVSIHKSNQKIMDIFINRDKNKSKYLSSPSQWYVKFGS